MQNFLNTPSTTVPERSGVYILFNNKKVGYIGKAESSIRQRFYQHFKNSNYHLKHIPTQEITKAMYIEFPSNKCKQIERELIKQLKPIWNKRDY